MRREERGKGRHVRRDKKGKGKQVGREERIQVRKGGKGRGEIGEGGVKT